MTKFLLIPAHRTKTKQDVKIIAKSHRPGV